MSTKGKTWRQPSEALRAMRAVMKQPESEDKGPAQALYRDMLKNRSVEFEKAWRAEERIQAAGRQGGVGSALVPSEGDRAPLPPAAVDEGTERVKELLADEVAEFMEWRAGRADKQAESAGT